MRDLSLHIMDILQNSISAKATQITVSVNAVEQAGELVVRIADNGVGMEPELLNRVTDPFITTRETRRVGLGISLLKASAQRADGDLSITSQKGAGTTVDASFKIGHIDRLPLGDIPETITSIIAAHPELELALIFESSRGSFEMTTREIKEKLGEVPIGQYEVIAWIKEFIHEGIQNTFGGVLDEIDC